MAWLSIVLAFIVAVALGLPLAVWLDLGVLWASVLGHGIYWTSLVFFWVVLDEVGRR